MNQKKVIVTLLGIVVLLLLPLLLSEYMLHLSVFILIYTLLALSVGMVLGYIGELSFGHAAFYGLGAYTSGLLTVKAGLSFWISLPIAILFTGLVGAFVGSLSLRTKGLYFALVTMGFGAIIHLVVNNWEGLTNGPMGLRGIKPPEPINLGVFTLSFDTKAQMYYLILFLTIITIFFVYRIISSPLGRVFISIREDGVLSEFMGLPTFRYKLLNFTLSSMVAGLAGVLSAHYVLFISPDFFTVTESVNMVLMVIIGGVGTIAGPVIGAFCVTLLLELLNLAGEYKMMIYGLFLMLFIIFFPQGLMGARKYLQSKLIKGKDVMDMKAEVNDPV